MITGDNPLTAVHVAQDVEIVDRDVMILDLKEGATADDREYNRAQLLANHAHINLLIPLHYRARLEERHRDQDHSR
jgi:magnesium-transporting ATPase (P-type)